MTLLNYLGFGKKKENYDLAIQKLKKDPEKFRNDPVYQKLVKIKEYYSKELIKPLALYEIGNIIINFQDEMISGRMFKETYNSIYKTPLKEIIRKIGD